MVVCKLLSVRGDVMTKLILSCAVAVLFLTSCDSGSGSSSKGTVQAAGVQFEGTWLNAQIKIYLKTNDPAELCKVKEFNETKSEEFLDGVVIDSEGAMYDFQLNGKSKLLFANVKADGSTTNVAFIEHAREVKCKGGPCPKLISLRVSKPNESTLNLTYGYLNTDGSYSEGPVEHVRLSAEQLVHLKKDAALCN